MKKTILTSSLISLILLLFACGQKTPKNDLIGVWELDKKDNGIKSDLMIMPIDKSENLEAQREPEIVLKFNENSILDFKQGPQSFRAKYSREKENLLLGTTEYKIIKLDSDSLIIIEKNQLLPTTFYYFKSDRNFEISKD